MIASKIVESRVVSSPRARRRRTLGAGALALAAASLLVSTSATPQAEPSPDAAPGSIRFVGKNGLVTAKGTFHRWRITEAELTPDDPASGFVEVEITIASLDSGNGRRDDHLRSEDFFESSRWPTATVRVHSARRDGTSERGNPRYGARFDVRIRDVTKTLPGSFEVVGSDPPQVEGRLTLNRVDFGVGEGHSRWNPLSIREEVPIEFSASLAR